MPVNVRRAFCKVSRVFRGAHRTASGKRACQLSNLQTCRGVAATRYLTGPSSVMRLSMSNDTDTGESTHNEPSESRATTIRVVNQIPMSRTWGPSIIHRSSANVRICTLVHECQRAYLHLSPMRSYEDNNSPILHYVVRLLSPQRVRFSPI